MKILREEYKYFINSADLIYLRSNLRKIMKIDQNVKSNDKYTITSLYFDTFRLDDFTQKLNGIKDRKKYRVRIYNQKYDHIKFECKRKSNYFIKKESTNISLEEAKEICNSNYTSLIDKKQPFFAQKSYIDLVSNQYRPRVIVEYDREAYLLKNHNTRITFDHDLRTFNHHVDLFNLKNYKHSVNFDNLIILEVKFNKYFPSFLTSLLSNTAAKKFAISKYVYASQIINHNPYEDKVFNTF